MSQNKTSFQLVCDMNNAFGNPIGVPGNVDVDRLHKQCLNVAYEYGELMKALGACASEIDNAVRELVKASKRHTSKYDEIEVRDALCDLHVYEYGAHHFMGLSADLDMKAVIEGVMTRFVKDHEDLTATIVKHAKAGVIDVYTEGEFPTMILKSGSDQLDAPAGKFLKSASYKQTVFPPAVSYTTLSEPTDDHFVESNIEEPIIEVTIHELKSEPENFERLMMYSDTLADEFIAMEFRDSSDRSFAANDRVEIREYHPKSDCYTGRTLHGFIMDIARFNQNTIVGLRYRFDEFTTSIKYGTKS